MIVSLSMFRQTVAPASSDSSQWSVTYFYGCDLSPRGPRLTVAKDRSRHVERTFCGMKHIRDWAQAAQRRKPAKDLEQFTRSFE
jgi:hypothetical protein